jgi:hypothetical protein
MTAIRPPTDTRAADGLPFDAPKTAPPPPSPTTTAEAEFSPPISPAPPPPPFGPPMPMQQERRRGANDRILWPLILIALGTVFLIGNYVANLGSLLFLALGAAFLVARIVQREYGLAVPAGILLGFGTFVALEANGWLAGTGTDTTQGGWFFVLLGAGFLAVYLIGARPALIWPLFPAAILAGFGLLLIGQDNLGWFTRFARLADFWPLVLVVIGLWLLVRGRIEPALRRPVGTIALALLLVYGLAMLASVIATNNLGSVNLGSGFSFRGPISETTDLSAPLAAGDTFRVANSSGNTTIRSGAPGTVQVTATTHRWASDQTIDVRLTPAGGIVSLTATPGSERYFGNTPTVDYTIAIPDGVRVEVTASSGNVAVSGITGTVVATVSSGSLTVSDINGEVTGQTSSGNLRLSNITGDLRATASSGNITATGIAQPRELTTTSGNITVSGSFAGDARINASSGNVTVRFTPESAVRITATTSSGAIRVNDLTLTARTESARSLTGTLGAGTGNLAIGTSSGNITVSTAR